MTKQMQFDFDTAMPVLASAAPAAARGLAGQLAFLAGSAAEESVARLYEYGGMQVAARRWRGSEGEIDLIMRDGEDLVFVEVKKSKSFAAASERLSMRQMQRIYGAASEFLAGEPRGQLTNLRFDVALVNGVGEIRVVENAFGHF